MSSYPTTSYFIPGSDKILAFVDHLESESEEEENNKVSDYIYYSNYKFVGLFDGWVEGKSYIQLLNKIDISDLNNNEILNELNIEDDNHNNDRIIENSIF